MSTSKKTASLVLSILGLICFGIMFIMAANGCIASDYYSSEISRRKSELTTKKAEYESLLNEYNSAKNNKNISNTQLHIMYNNYKASADEYNILVESYNNMLNQSYLVDEVYGVYVIVALIPGGVLIIISSALRSSYNKEKAKFEANNNINMNAGPSQGYNPNMNAGPSQGYNPNMNAGPSQGYNPNMNAGPSQGYNPNMNAGPSQGYNPNMNAGPSQGYNSNMNVGQQSENTATTNKTSTESLRELKTLFDEGLINEEEYAAKKADILGKM